MREEREVTCAACGGDGCIECAERGFYRAEFEPITMDDLDEMGANMTKDINKDISERFRRARALLDIGIEPDSSLPEEVAGCNHWPGQQRCLVCGMGLSATDRRT